MIKELFDPNISLVDMGIDDLDSIELLMEIGKEMNGIISDEEWGIVENSKNFYFVKEVKRDRKLNDLGV
jgi:acyl carrier protein